MSTSTTSVVTPEHVGYPVHVDAELDPHLSRGLWLVKWLLAIPHYVVLAFLWVGFAVSSILAFFAILFTARYPRALFDFNVGVMRWSWRVTYYAYGALGTDRYPPFTLAEVPDYPAHLTVDYPERLSRGLVLVKWWLLAIPHYLVIGLFVGGLGYGVRDADGVQWAGLSLIGLLVLVAGVVLLFSGRYPQPVFDLVLGLNRWVLRVAGYVALMTDRYPPFSLEQGGHEGSGRLLTRTAGGTGPLPPLPQRTPHVLPGAQPVNQPVTQSAVPPGRSGRGWTVGRVVSLVAGSMLVLGGLGLAGGGGVLAVGDQVARDADGFLMSPQERLGADGYAVVSEESRIDTGGTLTWLPEDVIGDVRLAAESTDGPVFVGIGPTEDVQAYLAGVERSVLLEVPATGPVYRDAGAGAPASAPAEQQFWVAQDAGDDVEVTWSAADGDWTAVLMNADGSASVAADVKAGAEVPALGTIVAVLWISAAVLLAVGALLIAVPVRLVGRDR